MAEWEEEIYKLSETKGLRNQPATNAHSSLFDYAVVKAELEKLAEKNETLKKRKL